MASFASGTRILKAIFRLVPRWYEVQLAIFCTMTIVDPLQTYYLAWIPQSDNGGHWGQFLKQLAPGRVCTVSGNKFNNTLRIPATRAFYLFIYNY